MRENATSKLAIVAVVLATALALVSAWQSPAATLSDSVVFVETSDAQRLPASTTTAPAVRPLSGHLPADTNACCSVYGATSAGTNAASAAAAAGLPIAPESVGAAADFTPIKFENGQLKALLPNSRGGNYRSWFNMDRPELVKLRNQFEQVRPQFITQYAESAEAASRFTTLERQFMRATGQMPEGWILHHKVPLFRGGTNAFGNFRVMRESFHWRYSRRLHYYPEGTNIYER